MGALGGKKVLMVIASKEFRDEEYKEPRRILESAGAAVTVACSSLNPSTGMLGAVVKPDILLRDAKVSDYAGVIFVGGMGAVEYWKDPVAHALAKNCYAAGKVTSAICLAPMTLANAGLLKGRKGTIWADAAAEFKAAGVLYTGASVEKEGLLITGSGPAAAAEFGNAVLEALRNG